MYIYIYICLHIPTQRETERERDFHNKTGKEKVFTGSKRMMTKQKNNTETLSPSTPISLVRRPGLELKPLLTTF